MLNRRLFALLAFVLLTIGIDLSAQAQDDVRLLAGAAAVNISPIALPAIRNGGFIEARSDRVDDALFARTLVLAKSTETIAICIVDSCMLPTDVCDAIKKLVNEQVGIPTDRILISATHTHTAPSTMSLCLGSRRDDAYTEQVIPQIARSIVNAHERLEPAQIGWCVVDAGDLTNCRRWLTRRDRMGLDPFGSSTVRAMMHPGYLNPDYVCPAGPIDPGLSIVSVVSQDSQAPICIMGNFSMHYFGAGPGFSADYYGLVADRLESHAAKSNATGFVGIMSQGTSGDLHWMDYSQPQRGINRQQYAESVAERILKAVEEIDYSDEHTIEMAETRFDAERRTPSDERLAWAKSLNEARGNRLPENRPEVYAQQAQWIHDNPTTEFVLQAIRIGELGITAIPNEVYGITGLRLKQQSPLPTTFNLELANGAEGYIPPPAQHALGGYTTWPARTAGLVENAEPQIVDRLLGLLEMVAHRERRPIHAPSSRYAEAIILAEPSAYWRLGDLADGTPQDSIGDVDSRFIGTHARYLSGPQGEGFTTSEDMNRAIYFIDARLAADLPNVHDDYSITMWFWNGMPAELSPQSACLIAADHNSTPVQLAIAGTDSLDDTGRLILRVGDEMEVGKSILSTRAWHHVALIRRDNKLVVLLDGQIDPDLVLDRPPSEGELTDQIGEFKLTFGGLAGMEGSFDGKLDEVAVFNRAFTGEENQTLYRIAGVARPKLPEISDGFARKPTDESSQLQYAESIRASVPKAYWRLHEADETSAVDEMEQWAAHYEGNTSGLPLASRQPNFSGGRVKATVAEIDNAYSVELWVKNEMPIRARPVTGYMFCRGGDGASGAPGDSLGIGGTHSWTGNLFVFNGNDRDEAVSGTTQLQPGSWNHVVFVREGEQVRAYLNGNVEPEFEGKLPVTYPEREAQFFIGGRNDNFANFHGAIEEVALYDRALKPTEIAEHFTAAKAEKTRDDSTDEESEPHPTSVDESVDLIHVPDGYRVELVASEPLVKDPVAIDWGPDGKLWVVEMADYPLGLDGRGKPGGRIRFLEDVDRDGTYDRSTLFASGLSYPTGILVWEKGVLVTAAPEIIYLEDRNGDGQADVRTQLYSGFLEGNQQLRVNGLRWGLDNWIYCASGSHHAGYGKESQIKSHLTNRLHQIGSRDFRIRPETGEIDPQSGPSQYGRNRDDWGNWFGVQNSLPLWHYVLADQDIRRNPHFAPPNPKHQVVTPTNPPVFPASRLQKRFHSFEQSGRFTSACSAMIYRDDLLFERGVEQHAFTCEPFHNLVQHNIIDDDGVSFSFRRPDSEGEFDFFASEDRWCRPVMARTGPDGALWVVDMYRYMIEHPQWLPENGKAELLPYYRYGEEQGRIYRIVPDSLIQSVPLNLAKATTEQLVSNLKSSNGWVRDTIQRLLLEQRDPNAAKLLTDAYSDNEEPLTKLHILCTLDGLDALSPELLDQALRHPHSGLRRHAVRLAARFPLSETLAIELSNDSDKKVLLQLATTLGAFQDPRAGKALAQIAVNHQDDEYIVAAVLSSLHEGNVAAVFTNVAQSMFEHGPQGESFFSLLDSLMGQTIAMGSPEVIANVALFAGGLGSGTIEPEHDRLLARVLMEMRKRDTSLADLPSEESRLLADRIDKARDIAANRDATLDQRIASVDLLLQTRENQRADFDLMEQLLSAQTPFVIQEAVIERCSQVEDSRIVELTTAGWQAHSPALRERVLALLTLRPAWTLALLEKLERRDLATSEISPAQRNKLLQIADDESKKRWEHLFESTSDQTRDHVIRRYRESFKLEGDTSRGQALFAKHCSNCHRFKEVGNDVGPNLASLTDKSDERLLASLFDPNSSVEAKYVSYVATDIDGRVHTGIIASETASSITIVSNEGDARSILRAEIEDLRSTGSSLMPTGLEEELSLQDVADIVQFIRQ